MTTDFEVSLNAFTPELSPCGCGGTAKIVAQGVECEKCGLTLRLPESFANDEKIRQWNAVWQMSTDNEYMGETMRG